MALASAAFDGSLERRDHMQHLEAFAEVVSHDLRNPLNIAQSRLELVRHECDSDHLDHVVAAHDRIETLIEDILTLAMTGQHVRETEPMALSILVETCWQHVSTAEATLVVETDRTTIADESRVRQLLANLFRNAVEHGGSDVTVTVGELPDGFFIEDDAPGIPPEDREAVFENGYSTATDGTGFGLGIVTQIAEAHGWTCRVTESAEGGARFEFAGPTTAEESVA